MAALQPHSWPDPSSLTSSSTCGVRVRARARARTRAGLGLRLGFGLGLGLRPPPGGPLVALYLPTSPYISLHLPTSPCTWRPSSSLSGLKTSLSTPLDTMHLDHLRSYSCAQG